MSWQIILAGLGMWFLVEGILYVVAPETVRKLGQLIGDMPVREVALSGVIAAIFGGAMLFAALRLF